MGLETGTYISDLVSTNPLGSDLKSEGDDHLRFIKSTVKATFPNISGAVTPTHTELNYVDGVTSAIQTQMDLKASIIYADSVATSNGIINGKHRIAQAGTSFAAPSSGAYDLDGWTNTKSSAAVFTIAQATGSSTGKLCRTVTVTTAETSIAAGDYATQTTLVEGYDAVKYLNATFTLGFYAISSVTGTHCVRFYNGTSTYVGTYTISVADTWEYKTITVTNGTPALASTTNAAGMHVSWTNLCGSTYQTTAGAWNAGNFLGTSAQVNDFATIGNVFGLQDVTLNLGTSPAVDNIHIDADIRRCQRYYYPFTVAVLASPTYGTYPISMMATPTITGGGAGFASTGTTSGSLICTQTAHATQSLVLSARM